MLQNRATHHSKKNLVSVIIPTYNRCSLLKEAIYSVYSQTYRPIQCIIVDDGSADETFAFVNSILSLNNEDFILQYLYQNNSGSQVARNAGTKVANGEYIQYLDSDDLLYPTKLATQVSYLNDHPECDAVFGDWDSGTKSSNNLIVAYASKDMIKQFLTLERNIANFSILMRRELVSHIGLWDVSIKRFQEIDFHLRGLMIGAIYHYQSLNTGLWRYHESPRIHNRAGLDAMCFFF
jgi:glycosyltransferase involved in cell wall biosynthesis